MRSKKFQTCANSVNIYIYKFQPLDTLKNMKNCAIFVHENKYISNGRIYDNDVKRILGDGL